MPTDVLIFLFAAILAFLLGMVFSTVASNVPVVAHEFFNSDVGRPVGASLGGSPTSDSGGGMGTVVRTTGQVVSWVSALFFVTGVLSFLCAVNFMIVEFLVP